MNKDERVGKKEEIKGKIKEKVGHAVGSPDLEERGENEARAGKAQHDFGTARRNLGEAIEEIGEKIKK